MPEILPASSAHPGIVAYCLWKTGSMSLHYEFQARGGLRACGQHDPVSDRRDMRWGRVSVGTIANPLHWWPSLYGHARSVNSEDYQRRLRDLCGGDVTFENFYHGASSGFEHRLGVVAHAGDVEDYRRSGVGLMTWCAWWMYADRGKLDPPTPSDPMHRYGVDYLLPRDRFAEGVAELVGDNERRRDEDKINARTRRPYESFFEDCPDVAALILERERPLFDVGGWDRFGPARRPLLPVRDVALDPGPVGTVPH